MTMEFLMHVDLKSWTPHFVKSSFFTLWHWASVRYIVTCIPMREFHGLLFLPIKSDIFCHFASPVGKIRRFRCKAKQPAAVLMAYDLGKELILRPCFNLKVQVSWDKTLVTQCYSLSLRGTRALPGTMACSGQTSTHRWHPTQFPGFRIGFLSSPKRSA